jgi:hypothetical protein
MTAAHDAPPILSSGQEAVAEAAFEAWVEPAFGPLAKSGTILSQHFRTTWLAAWRACRHATLLEVERQREDAARIACGASHPDPRVEARFDGLREAAGQPTGGGCWKLIPWTAAYRCVQCGRWGHERCLRAHFAESGHDAEVERSEVFQ